MPALSYPADIVCYDICARNVLGVCQQVAGLPAGAGGRRGAEKLEN